MADQVIVFIDEQNFYRGARRAFFGETDHRTRGNCNPVDLGSLLAAHLPVGVSAPRALKEVRVYTGLADPNREPKGHAAHTKRMTAWQAAGATVISRPLRYPANWQPNMPGEQKGVDVALAIDFVDLALDHAYDVGIIGSTDSDLRPALEFVIRRCPTLKPETATWWSDKSQKSLSLAGHVIWCHRLSKQNYQAVCDHNDYLT